MWGDNSFNSIYALGFNALASYEWEQYFMPTSCYWWVIYYRPSLFEKAGIESEPQTWDEFINVIEKLQEADITPITIGTRYRWTAAARSDYLNMQINGPKFHISLTDLDKSYTDSKVKKFFKYWGELIDMHAFIDSSASYSWSEALNPMIQGETTMYLMGDYYFAIRSFVTYYCRISYSSRSIYN